MQNKSNAVKLFIRNIKLNAKNLESWKCCDSALDECFVAQLVKKLVMDPGFRYHCNLFLSMSLSLLVGRTRLIYSSIIDTAEIISKVN